MHWALYPFYAVVHLPPDARLESRPEVTYSESSEPLALQGVWGEIETSHTT